VRSAEQLKSGTGERTMADIYIKGEQDRGTGRE